MQPGTQSNKPRYAEYTWQVTLHNFKEKDVTVNVQEVFGGARTLIGSDHKFSGNSGQLSWAPVTVPHNGTAVVTYTIKDRFYE